MMLLTMRRLASASPKSTSLAFLSGHKKPLSASVRCLSSVAPPTSNHKHTPLPNPQNKILYTETDEAPALATFSLYPVVQKVSQN